MKNSYEFDILERLDDDDKFKIKYFIQLLVQEEKYRKLRDEILSRREEIEQNKTLTHDEIWANLNA